MSELVTALELLSLQAKVLAKDVDNNPRGLDDLRSRYGELSSSLTRISILVDEIGEGRR